MTAAQDVLVANSSDAGLSLWQTAPNNIQIFERITSVQIAGNSYPESELSQCLQQKKFSKKYSPKHLVCEPPSLFFKLSS